MAEIEAAPITVRYLIQFTAFFLLNNGFSGVVGDPRCFQFLVFLILRAREFSFYITIFVKCYKICLIMYIDNIEI